MESGDPRWPPEEAAQGKMHSDVLEGEEKVVAREILPMMMRRMSLGQPQPRESLCRGGKHVLSELQAVVRKRRRMWGLLTVFISSQTTTRREVKSFRAFSFYFLGVS